MALIVLSGKSSEADASEQNFPLSRCSGKCSGGKLHCLINNSDVPAVNDACSTSSPCAEQSDDVQQEPDRNALVLIDPEKDKNPRS